MMTKATAKFRRDQLRGWATRLVCSSPMTTAVLNVIRELDEEADNLEKCYDLLCTRVRCCEHDYDADGHCHLHPTTVFAKEK